MKQSSLSVLGCPTRHTNLIFTGQDTGASTSDTLTCSHCQKTYPVVDGIPHCSEAQALNGFNRRFAHLFDLFAWGYRAFSKIAFAYIGMDKETGRREITDRLEPHRGKVLEVSIGPGVNLPNLVNRPDVGKVLGLDISFGQLIQCQRYISRKNWDIDLFLGNGEQLPFQDKSFGGVFHVGGINFFNNKQAAIDEMIRVVKPGAQILIADETERGARAYEKTLPGFKKSFNGKRDEIVAPLELVPNTIVETRMFDVWKGLAILHRIPQAMSRRTYASKIFSRSSGHCYRGFRGHWQIARAALGRSGRAGSHDSTSD